MEVQASSDVWTVHLLNRAAPEVHPRVREGAFGAWLHAEALALVIIANAEVSIEEELL